MPSPEKTPCIDFTEAEIRRFAPAIRDFYLKTLLSEAGRNALAESGILANGRRLAHFLGQVGAETGGLTLLRESLAYSTVKRIREVWPARSADDTDAELTKLLRNPVGLGDWAYGGRIGNAKGAPGHPHPDGYDFRGGGWIQTTGRDAVERFCARLGVEVTAGALDDPLLTLKFACLEWASQGCNALADAGDVVKISKAINVGNPNSTVKPNGMEERKAWTEKAKALWWEREASPVWEEDLAVEAVRARVEASANRPLADAVLAPHSVSDAGVVAPVAPPALQPAGAWETEVRPEPVFISGPSNEDEKMNTAPPAAPGMLSTAKSSGSVSALLNTLMVLVAAIGGFLAWVWNWLITLLDVLPLITRDVGGSIEQGEKIAKFLKLPPEKWIAISAAVIVPLIAIAVVRHTWDKIALLIAKAQEGTPSA